LVATHAIHEFVERPELKELGTIEVVVIGIYKVTVFKVFHFNGR
jgi:hypothetical protein